MKFAKIYDTCEHHQILVRLTMHEDNYAVAFSTMVDDIGVMEVIHGFPTPSTARAAWEAATKSVASEMIKGALQDLRAEIVKVEEKSGVMH
jgi:hypothetical protein